MENDEDDERLKLLIAKQLENRPAPKVGFSFSKEINLGHLVVAVTFLLGAFGTYLSFHDSNVDHANRVHLLEQQAERTERTLNQLATNQDRTEKAVTQLTWIVERIEKKEAGK